ncbi:hypothetical protein P4H42_01490 [Paenibacillus macerans]|uniref:hypothetical protein n=1 Tax=Paenibacillus macerans TaxID=44252 RepID=UPI002A20094E|nr:hypothetical protein [Paenibacillus macerans]MBS5910441.1 hypothetical protein [Paenibacillus macerans]MEC0328299.1 hypothetical protein [Paenibacillus macerans]
MPDIAGITTVFALIFTPETFKAFFRISDLCVAIPEMKPVSFAVAMVPKNYFLHIMKRVS